jgi:hypothetical protein
LKKGRGTLALFDWIKEKTKRIEGATREGGKVVF